MAAPLPPLNALRVFEAAARHMSFSKASEELSVTPTAVSHQIKHLEAHLGTALFRREPRRLTLTADGVAWAIELREVFSRLAEANRRLRAPKARERPMVSVSVIPSLGARWLAPRLGRFLAQHGDIDVRISPTAHLVDFAAEAVDLAIRYGTGRYPGLVVEKLADDEFIVVCAPRLGAKVRTAAALARHVLLCDDEPDIWPTWLASQGQRGTIGARTVMLTDSAMVVTAAVEGQGIAMVRRSLAVDDLAAGRLTLLFPRVRTPTGRAYYMVAPRETLRRAEVVAFRDWLRGERGSLYRG
jgi:LysR family glycine cleavage system transcriptional activator